MNKMTFQQRCSAASNQLQILQRLSEQIDEGVTLLHATSSNTADTKLVAVVIKLLAQAKAISNLIYNEFLPELELEETAVAAAIRIAANELSIKVQNARDDMERHVLMTSTKRAEAKRLSLS
jgi:hypothetical protein